MTLLFLKELRRIFQNRKLYEVSQEFQQKVLHQAM